MGRASLLYAGLLALFPPVFAIDPVTITRAIPANGHSCVSRCLYYTVFADLGSAMGCGAPYDNTCFCATATSAFASADDFIGSCASARCSAGDLSQDITSMQSIYASYCMGAGYTQAGATNWFNPAEVTSSPGDENGNGDDESEPPAPSQTENSGSAIRTTTQRTIVTETTESAAATESVVTIHETSTAWVHPDGSPANPPGSNSGGGDDSKWKIAVGVAVPLVAIIAAVAAWFLWRRRNGRKKENVAGYAGHPPSEYPQSQASPDAMTSTPISRKPVASPTVSSLSRPTEVAGEGIPQELTPQGVDAIPTAPPAYTGGRHEVQGQATWPENHGHSTFAEVPGDGQAPQFNEVSGHGRAPELPAAYQRPRSELPGNDRFTHT